MILIYFISFFPHLLLIAFFYSFSLHLFSFLILLHFFSLLLFFSFHLFFSHSFLLCCCSLSILSLISLLFNNCLNDYTHFIFVSYVFFSVFCQRFLPQFSKFYYLSHFFFYIPLLSFFFIAMFLLHFLFFTSSYSISTPFYSCPFFCPFCSHFPL